MLEPWMKPVTRKCLGLPSEKEEEYRIDGKTLTASQCSRRSGIPVNTLKTRIARGMTMEEAMAAPYTSRSMRG